MKAKEWAAKLRETQTEEKWLEVVQEMLKEFISDIRRLNDEREVKTIAGLRSIILELSQKWKAVSRRSGGKLKEDGFMRILKEYSPKETAQVLKKNI